MSDTTNTNNTTPEIIPEAQEEAVEVNAEQLAGNLTTEPAQATEEQEPQAQEEQSPEEKQKAALIAGITSLVEDGWTSDELQAFSTDPQSYEDIKSGKTVRQAFRAYLKRQTSAEPKSAATKKTSVPTLRQSATSGAKDETLVENMSDEEFAKYSAKAMALAQEGKKVRIR